MLFAMKQISVKINEKDLGRYYYDFFFQIVEIPERTCDGVETTDKEANSLT